MSKVTNLWGWVIAIATGLAIVYGLNIPKFATGEREEFSMAEKILYGGFHRLAWAIAVAWVIFTCCRGYGGNCFFIQYVYHTSLDPYKIATNFYNVNISKRSNEKSLEPFLLDQCMQL